MAYKTFANGFPLPASDLNNYLMNQSVIVFADAAARTAAIASPTEGMVTYLEDGNTVEVYDGSAWTDINDNTAAIPKSTVTAAEDLIVADGASSVTNLAVGSEGDVLSVSGGAVSWVAPGGGGDATWTELSNTTVTTGVSSYTVSGLSEYDKFAVIIRNFQASSGGVFYSLDFNGRSALYGTRTQMRPLSSSNIEFSTSSTTSLSFSQSSTNTINNSGTFFFVGSKGTSPVFYSFNGGAASTASSNYTLFGSGALGKTASISEFTISVTGGATFSSGTLIIYGA